MMKLITVKNQILDATLLLRVSLPDSFNLGVSDGCG